MLDFAAIEKAPVAKVPFPHFLVEKALPRAALDKVRRDFPAITSHGVYPLAELEYGPEFEGLIKDIQSDQLRDLIGQKLGVPMDGLPQMITVRGRCAKKDGRIHTDSTDKVVTCLLYLNEADWAEPSGRLRLLRSGTSLDDMIAEVPPNGGTLVVFKRTDNSWHGHHPFEGERRYVMFNWVTSDVTLAKNLGRHKLSARLKRLLPFA